MAGPTPRTRSNPSREPKGPSESRSATMRRASAGPMRGRRSRDSAGAVSRSTGTGFGGSGDRGIGGDFERLGRAERRERGCTLAESTSAIWRASAARAASEGGVSLPEARWNRTPAPRSATAEKKIRAWRSEGVTVNGHVGTPASTIATRRAERAIVQSLMTSDLTERVTARTLSGTKTPRGASSPSSASRRCFPESAHVSYRPVRSRAHAGPRLRSPPST